MKSCLHFDTKRIHLSNDESYDVCKTCGIILERTDTRKKEIESDGREYEDHNWLK